MVIVRRHLRSLAIAWMLFQATLLSALVPRACCLTHEGAMTTNVAECHDHATVQCPESSADGAPCAMHQLHGGSHHHTGPNDQKPTQCAIRGTCGGPLSALLAIFTTQGVLTDSSQAFPDIRTTNATAIAADQLIALLTSPEAPPPRS